MLIPYVDIQRTDYHTEEAAQAMLENLERREESRKALYEADGDVYIPRHFKVGRTGSVIFKMAFNEIAAGEISMLHEYEQEHVEAQNLMKGRKILPAHNGAEHGSGLTAGLGLFDD
jgi:hypothetical protein